MHRAQCTEQIYTFCASILPTHMQLKRLFNVARFVRRDCNAMQCDVMKWNKTTNDQQKLPKLSSCLALTWLQHRQYTPTTNAVCIWQKSQVHTTQININFVYDMADSNRWNNPEIMWNLKLKTTLLQASFLILCTFWSFVLLRCCFGFCFCLNLLLLVVVCWWRWIIVDDGGGGGSGGDVVADFIAESVHVCGVLRAFGICDRDFRVFFFFGMSIEYSLASVWQARWIARS